MTWGSFFIKTVGLLVVLCLVFFYGYGNFFLADNVVPYEGMEVGEWLYMYNISGGLSGLAGLVCAAFWFWIGDAYSGESGVGVKYYGLMILSLILGLVIAFLVLPTALEGSGFASVFVVITAPLLYYLASVFAYASPVKYIPAGAEIFHK